MRPIEPDAGQQPDRAAIEARIHAVAVEFDLVQPFRTFRRLLHELRQWRRIQSGKAATVRRAADRAIGGLSKLFDGQASGGKRAKQLGFRPGEVEPGQPVRAIEDDHLPIVNRRHVGTVRLSVV
jgi:hypothetical protein